MYIGNQLVHLFYWSSITNFQLLLICHYILCCPHTDELLPQSAPLPQVVLSQQQHVDDAHQRHHVRDVVGAVKLVHDHTEAILLRLQALNTDTKTVSGETFLKSLSWQSKDVCFLPHMVMVRTAILSSGFRAGTRSNVNVESSDIDRAVIHHFCYFCQNVKDPPTN